jgi:hypothetical protein
MFCWLIPILSVTLYLELRGRSQLHFLMVTVNPINKFIPCAEGNFSGVCCDRYFQSYKYNCTVCWRIGFSCKFCRLLSILSIQLYLVLKDRFQLHVLLVSVNHINPILPCAEWQVSAGYSAVYCQTYQYNFTVCWSTGFSCMLSRFLLNVSINFTLWCRVGSSACSAGYCQ